MVSCCRACVEQVAGIPEVSNRGGWQLTRKGWCASFGPLVASLRDQVVSGGSWACVRCGWANPWHLLDCMRCGMGR